MGKISKKEKTMFFKRKCKITFIKHGATINTEEHRFFDDETFPSLNETGKMEMEKISQWVYDKGIKTDKIYTSSAQRCVQSARILSQVCEQDFEILENLSSRKSGSWSGLSLENIEEKFTGQLSLYYKEPQHFTPVGGESLEEFNNRISEAIENIVKNNLYKRIIIITHGDVIQSAIAKALNVPLDNQFKIYVPAGSATQISYFEDFSSLVYSAYIPL